MDYVEAITHYSSSYLIVPLKMQREQPHCLRCTATHMVEGSSRPTNIGMIASHCNRNGDIASCVQIDVRERIFSIILENAQSTSLHEPRHVYPMISCWQQRKLGLLSIEIVSDESRIEVIMSMVSPWAFRITRSSSSGKSCVDVLECYPHCDAFLSSSVFAVNL